MEASLAASEFERIPGLQNLGQPRLDVWRPPGPRRASTVQCIAQRRRITRSHHRSGLDSTPSLLHPVLRSWSPDLTYCFLFYSLGPNRESSFPPPPPQSLLPFSIFSGLVPASRRSDSVSIHNPRLPTMAPKDTAAMIRELSTPPPPGSPYGVPIPGSERPGRSAVYRNWRFRDQPLLATFDPEIQTLHDLFEQSVRRYPNNRCFGTRNWNPANRSWEEKFDWITYAEVGERRKNLGAGFVEIHKSIGHPKDKYGVGLWSPNRQEWQITGMLNRTSWSRSWY